MGKSESFHLFFSFEAIIQFILFCENMTKGASPMDDDKWFVRLFHFSGQLFHDILFETTFLGFVGNNTPTEFDDHHTVPA